MKDLGQRALILVMLFSLGALGCQDKEVRPKQLHRNETNNRTSAGASLQNHPYGRPVSGALMWENDRRFREFCARQKAAQRMAAFQTTLPNPLPGEESNVALAADLLRGTMIRPGGVFSMNAMVGPYTRRRGYREGPTYQGNRLVKTIGGGVCKIASTLYNVTVLANLKVVERHPHGMPVPYVPPGQDATVADGAHDFRFQNTSGAPLVIWADTKGNTLYMAFYGRTKPPRVIWGHRVLNRRPTRTVYRHNTRLQPGQTRVAVPGADGLAVKSWLNIQWSAGRTERKELGTDYYRPLPKVVERG